jgi:hypothetical protein
VPDGNADISLCLHCVYFICIDGWLAGWLAVSVFMYTLSDKNQAA